MATKKIRLGINGYGRIGRGVHRQAIESDDIEVVAINSRSEAASHAHLLKYDSIYGKCRAKIEVLDDNHLKIQGKKVYVHRVKDPKDMDWGEHDVDIVIECTGRFTNMKDAKKHLGSGAKNVLITAPCKDKEIPNIVMGVNDEEIDLSKFQVLSNASCTTNCLATTLKVLNDHFGVEQAFVTTIHAFTYTQNLHDNSNPDDFRRARATTQSIIPTTTGAMKAIGRVIPELEGKIDGMAMRVPVATVSCLDMSVKVKKGTTVEEVNKMFRKASRRDLQGILSFTDEPLVSIDFKGSKYSSVIDQLSTKVMDGNFVKVIAWYDNEWAYISRVVDLVRWMCA
ncbi:type I glyceraldehyde-3-phosphate dehydrogenase [Candidatus Gracilibacteria bacterium]|nr:type I glyceraldehyde-3-phosphate dehydrogenase [Candidatus Gracilibacteria bacterium]